MAGDRPGQQTFLAWNVHF